MYIIKFNDDKSLTTTKRVDIYKGDKNADKLLIYMPQEYGEVDIADCTVIIRFVKPGGSIVPITPDVLAEQHAGYYQYCMNIDERITDTAGTMEVWVSVINVYDDLVMRTGSVFIDILETRES